ncbi:uncharacterized protein KGF55_002651 [Candida pseudojiufengensis]|uniref:uncharacterized protein n=1 Tax=Candida pseudojiufengensis TaxID=497109 RepID=UPI0022243171|nr:uncharacterized protein KGF55_002651 [Candida pseudojiufengensis]KAI5963771.1 hypothetical protein KGF55_002651 [Candida pseudojiufengensis]
MNLLRRAKAIKDISLLEKPINAFINRIDQEQSKNSGALLRCIDLLIDQNQSKIIKKYKIPDIDDPFDLKQEIWDNLKTRKTDLDPKLIRRLKHEPPLNNIKFTKEYHNFIKELYPLDNQPFKTQIKFFNLENNHKKYDKINHEKLYKKYLELPKPAPQYLPPLILKDFSSKFILNNQKFANRNVIEGHLIKENKSAIRRSMRNEIYRRKEYHDICLKILNDVKKAGFEITEQEQIRMIYLSFFKDRDDVAKHLNDLNLYNSFTFKDYQSILETFGKRNDLLGVLLFLAIRHDKFDIISDILPQVGLGHIIDLEDTDNFKLIDISLTNLLEYFTTHIDRPDHFKYLSRTINCITKLPVITNEIIDQIIKLLTNFGLIKHAEILFETAYFKYTGEQSTIISEWLYIYTQLKKITNDSSIFFKLSATHSSFLHLITAYCESQSFDKVEQLKYIIDNLSTQRMSTRLYLEIFKGLKQRDDWGIEELKISIKMLIDDLVPKDESEMISENIKSGLRVSNLLIELIFTICADKLHTQGISVQDKINNLKQLNLKWSDLTRDKKTGAFEADRNAYINNAFLNEIYTIMLR